MANRLHAPLIPIAVVLVLLIWSFSASRAEAQTLYSDAWSDDMEVPEDDPTAWYWGYGSTEWNGLCPNTGGTNCEPLNMSAELTGRNTGGGVIAYQNNSGFSYASATVQGVVGPSSPDGDYPLDVYHGISYVRLEGGINFEDFNWVEFLVDNIKFGGVNNRYVYSSGTTNPWMFVRDDCHATCQNDQQWLNSDPGVGQTPPVIYLHRRVRRVGFLFFSKCFSGSLKPYSYRGACTT